MHPITGQIYETANDDVPRRAGHIAVDERDTVDALRFMNRAQRRKFAAIRRQGKSEKQALAGARR